MSDNPIPTTTTWVATCDTSETLASAAGLFTEYRRHYGQSPVGDERTLDWLTGMVRSRMLTVFTASVDTPTGPSTVGLATSHVIPASLVMGQSWQLRDLYVLPHSRRRGAAAALVGAVRDAARAAGATQLTLLTESDNHDSLGLHERMGFATVEGLDLLRLDLAPEVP